MRPDEITPEQAAFLAKNGYPVEDIESIKQTVSHEPQYTKNERTVTGYLVHTTFEVHFKPGVKFAPPKQP